MKWRWLGPLVTAAALAGFTGTTQAGAVRFAGRRISRTSTAVAHAAMAGGSAVADGAATAGKATGKGPVILAKGAKALPGEAARGTEKVAKAMGKAIW